MINRCSKQQFWVEKIFVGIIGIVFFLVSCSLTDSPTEENSLFPSAVGNFKVNSSTDSQVVLSWTAPNYPGIDGTNTATLSGYLVKYKKTAEKGFIEIDKTGEGVRLSEAWQKTNTTATVIGLTPSTSYTFLVVASNSANRVALDNQAPKIERITAPASLGSLSKVLTCNKATSVDLTWTASPGASFYKLYRDDIEIESITNSYTDIGLAPSTSYTYKVQACSDVGCSGDSAPLTITTAAGGKTLESIITSGKVSADLSGYDERSREIFSLYDADTPIVAKYVKVGGTGDGSSFIDAAGDPKAVVDGITSSATNIYMVFLEGGTYTPDEMGMKNHVAIVGGVDGCLGSSAKATILDGEGSRRIFVNTDLDKSALLYGVTITNGYTAENGGGIYNDNSSPSLTRVIFSENRADEGKGGAMYNDNSSPTLIGATFSGNSTRFGGAMYNSNSSPVLIGVTFSGNTATNGGGMYNRGGASPIMIGVTFSGNTANRDGGGMYHYNGGGDGSLIINGIFWGNQSVSDEGPNFYFNNEGSVSGNLGIYNSTIQWGTKDEISSDIVSGATYTSNFFSAGFAIEGGTAPVTISFSNISDIDPQLVALTNNGGSVLTHAIPSTSPAVNQGLYVKREDTTYYYSANNTDWHTEPDLSEKGDPPTDAEDLTATDARGVTRVGRPDHGAYEYGASQ